MHTPTTAQMSPIHRDEDGAASTVQCRKTNCVRCAIVTSRQDTLIQLREHTNFFNTIARKSVQKMWVKKIDFNIFVIN